MKNYNEILSSMAKNTKQNIGEEFKVDITSIWSLVIGAPTSLAVSELYQKILDMENKMSIFTATGSDLDNLLNNLGFYRKQPSFASGKWYTDDSVPGTYILAGQLIFSKEDGITYTNVDNVTINDSGYAEISIVCQSQGSVGNAESETINTIVSTVAGLGTGTNLEALSDGQDQESDIEFLDSYLKGYTNSYWNIDGIYSEISRQDGVLSTKVYENDADSYHPIYGMPPKSIWCIVEGGNEEDIAQAIFDKSDTGIERYGDIEIVKIDLQGDERIVKFSRPTKINIEFYYSITGNIDTSIVTQSIIDYINNEDIAGTLSQVGAWEEIRTNVDVSNIISFTLYMRKEGNVGFLQNLVFNYNENGNGVQVQAP